MRAKLFLILSFFISTSAYADFQLVDENGNVSFDSDCSTSAKTKISYGTTPPAGDCTTSWDAGRLFYDSDATSGKRVYACEGVGGWVLQGDGGGTPAEDSITASLFADEDWGDISISTNVASVENDSHTHNATTLVTDSVSADELNATGVEAELEAVIDLQDIQGAVTDGQVPNTIIVEAFPVGAVFISVVSTDPATLLGYGTWSAIGAGKMFVGRDSGDTDFDTAEETGGAKTKTIAQENLPNISTGAGTAHTHVQDTHNHNFLPRSATTGSVSSIVTGTLDTSSTISGANQPHNQTTVATNQNESAHTHSLGGSGTALNVVNPYFVVYAWKRTA